MLHFSTSDYLKMKIYASNKNSRYVIQIISYNNEITIVFDKINVKSFQPSSFSILQRNFLSRLIKTFIASVIFLYYN